MALLGRRADADVAARAGVWPVTARAERRRRGIAPYRVRGPEVAWTDEMLSLLGTDTDAVVAEQLGLRVGSVSYRRLLLGIPAYGPRPGPRSKVRWRPRMIALLGTASDRTVAKRLGLTLRIVWRKRRELRIPSFAPPILAVVWSKAALWMLGRRRDSDIARQLGIRPATMLAKRQALGIPPFQPGRPVVRTIGLKRLLVLPNRALRAKHGLSGQLIARLRREYGVRAPGSQPPRWTPEVVARLGREPDTVIARDLGIAPPSVVSKRRTLGIPALPDARWRRFRKRGRRATARAHR